MTDALTFTDIADRVEQLTGRCRETDYLICEALHPFLAEYGYKRTEGDSGYYSARPSIKGGEKIAPASEYTGSVDAAIMAVPEGRYWHVGYGRTRDDEPLGGASIIEAGTLFTVAEAEAPTAELALTAAALRAHAYDVSRAAASMESANG